VHAQKCSVAGLLAVEVLPVDVVHEDVSFLALRTEDLRDLCETVGHDLNAVRILEVQLVAGGALVAAAAIAGLGEFPALVAKVLLPIAVGIVHGRSLLSVGRTVEVARGGIARLVEAGHSRIDLAEREQEQPTTTENRRTNDGFCRMELLAGDELQYARHLQGLNTITGSRHDCLRRIAK